MDGETSENTEDVRLKLNEDFCSPGLNVIPSKSLTLATRELPCQIVTVLSLKLPSSSSTQGWTYLLTKIAFQEICNVEQALSCLLAVSIDWRGQVPTKAGHQTTANVQTRKDEDYVFGLLTIIMQADTTPIQSA